MSDREKLALAVCEATQKTNYKCEFNCEKKGKCAYCLIIADHLIANGVTIQKWIPVTERFPEKAGFYLGYYQVRGDHWRVSTLHWNGTNWNNIGYIPPWVVPTHWMPLPEPPKGE